MPAQHDSLGKLGDLPPEIRNNIYCRIFRVVYTVPAMKIEFSDDEEDLMGRVVDRNNTRSSLAILRVSRQIYEEAKPVLYNDSYFDYDVYQWQDGRNSLHQSRYQMNFLLSKPLGCQFRKLAVKLYPVIESYTNYLPD